MKRTGWCVSVFLILILSGFPTHALETAPSNGLTPKIAGPLIVTGYSFSGHSLRYLQIYNSSDEVVDLAGWRVSLEHGAMQHNVAELEGLLAPNTYATVANSVVLPSATFVFTDIVNPIDPILSSVTLQAPAASGYLNEVASPSIVSSTPRIAGAPASFYFSRNVSTTTGNYLTSFSAFIPTANFTLLSDSLYVLPISTGLRVVEIYPDSPLCSPLDMAATCVDYVKVYNDSPTAINLSLYRIRTGHYGQATLSSNTATMSGLLDAGHYVSVPLSLSSSGSWVWLEDTYGRVSYEPTLTEYPSSSGHDEQSWAFDAGANEWRWSMYPSPGNAANNFGPVRAVNNCRGILISEIAANVATEDQFIEIKNASIDNIDMTGCMLQTNRSTVKQYVLEGALRAGDYRAIYIRDTELTLTKTTSGTVYLLSSDGLQEMDAVTYDNLAENTSWAVIDDVWHKTYSLSAGVPNIWLEHPLCDIGLTRNTDTGLCNKVQSAVSDKADCDEGKYRNLDTNRCRTLEAATNHSVCDAGEYRSVETNRCRSLVSTASILAPCAANQERNPETNRCRSVENSSQLTPCASNQERNPETNRCRNKAGSVTADFPVQTVAQAGEATIGWWAFGGVGAIAAGYAGWEWRREVLGWVKKTGLFGIGRL